MLDLVDLGTSYDILTKSGSFYSYSGERIGQGREQAKEYLKQNVDVAKRLESEIRLASSDGISVTPKNAEEAAKEDSALPKA